ncbi:hypothetical protein HanXRQr2_Chr01g0015391 [Helianthus annuus]|uniref:Uncharacterized protein n=1 Tax=Helianthus annuus TaxID=4232 RepID=A0A251VF43_HELAN|nr:uncharacterized protein LOC110910024 [Helianthus annuus]XP_035832858.1 uncharacterized protein LOC110910024 [Helianthus annuus]XP_035832860.1 uncharacterized protein LOC110910024 [Helianthus annuus]XP_035832862.1 uncharacterized protein LOC110910024 [Helianthus annuus]XP_035832863.1 uncharacterized protein LOC110910024 [Helianthus annuus]XP_035832864.1 uncharacterized protein LOC110910024 [Helianthus annuus]XP_035832865.1 uncharacterized protein LOC110910024 [Helianthus annuus]XP_03583286
MRANRKLRVWFLQGLQEVDFVSLVELVIKHVKKELGLALKGSQKMVGLKHRRLIGLKSSSSTCGLDKAICKTAKEIAKPIIAEQIPKFKIDSVQFEHLTLWSLPPTFQGYMVKN